MSNNYKLLYQPSSEPFDWTAPYKRRRGKKVTYQQVAFMTDCLRLLANRLQKSIADTSALMQQKMLYPVFYKLLKQEPALSKVQIVNRIHKLIV